MPCYPPCHVSPYCHPAARAQSSFSLREAAFWDVQKEHPPPRARCPGALARALIGLQFSVWTGACYWHGVDGSVFNSSPSAFKRAQLAISRLFPTHPTHTPAREAQRHSTKNNRAKAPLPPSARVPCAAALARAKNQPPSLQRDRPRLASRRRSRFFPRRGGESRATARYIPLHTVA